MARDAARQIEAIQVLRGVAASLVVLFHLRLWLGGPGSVGDRLFANGAAGVDLFFLISGFIMVHVTADSACRARDVAGFLVKRWSRIWPPYVIASLVYVLCDPDLALDAQTASDLGKAFVFYPRSEASPPFFGWAPLVVGWTLCYEVWFYVVFAVSMAFKGYRWFVLATLFVTLLIFVPALLTRPTLNAYAPPTSDIDLLGLLTNSMMWEFAGGALIAAIYRSRFALPAFWAVIAAATAATVFVWSLLLGWGLHGPLVWGLPSAGLLLATVMFHKSRPLRFPRWLVWLGDISFSLYLAHRIVQIGLLHFFPELGLGRWIAPAGAYAFASIALSLILATISHRYLERGLSEWVRRRLLALSRSVHDHVLDRRAGDRGDELAIPRRRLRGTPGQLL